MRRPTCTDTQIAGDGNGFSVLSLNTTGHGDGLGKLLDRVITIGIRSRLIADTRSRPIERQFVERCERLTSGSIEAAKLKERVQRRLNNALILFNMSRPSVGASVVRSFSRAAK